MTKKTISKNEILNVLANVRDGDSERDIVASGMVGDVRIDTGQVIITLNVDPARGAMLEPLRQEAEIAVSKLKTIYPDIKNVIAVLTAEKQAEKKTVNDPHGNSKNPKLELPIRKIIAVASGKGGVGKSTLAAAIARNLAKDTALKIGLLDADIYGPNQPRLMKLEGRKLAHDQDKNIIPHLVDIEGNAHGLKVMSIGFMVDAAKALVWRGPMVQSAIYQMFRDVNWGSAQEPLDVLIVDMPPGTGDAQLTLAQKIAVDGAIIVSTPQDLALADARKGVEMFRAVGVPILGLIENMSTHICSACGHEEHIFGHGGARREAQALGVPFLGEVALSSDIRASADAGESFDLDDMMLAHIRDAIAQS